ncbi:transcriptional regulator [Corallococcus coralloides DSM 2259]|uniref:Transcriptional regulator n=1 Tax=Corallococcus coralloides (strain ATCC 25202 / DSM 2259 / NBRC 100086 / M2) TaxID=1144275 RepID=H8MJQ9_CORCM|nr:XRE family transcriptional regulator [Corallococcus coralloides]AFE06703.1 transcriptional regulator [Corallococcus coralloides DSM 2259]
MERGEFLRSWRADTGFSAGKVAQLAQLPESTVEGIESGAHDPSFEELDALAGVLGLRADEIYDDHISESAPREGIRLLMKSAVAYRPSEAVRLRMLEAAAAARDLLDLQSELRPSRGGFERFASRPLASTADAPFKLGDELAREVRKQLVIQGPIISMRDLAQETLGIPIIAAELSADGPDAFSVYAPGRRAAIILNLQGKNTHPLVRRFSIAHEVGHVLFDRPGMGAFGVACKVDPGRGLDIESRANAFAMRLLLPHTQITQLSSEILKPAIFRKTMEMWGVHFSALQLYAEKVLNLSRDEAKHRLPDVDRSSPNQWAMAEELAEERRGLGQVPVPRRGALARLVLNLVRKDQISHARARELLSINGVASIEELAAEADVSLDGE